MSAVEYLTLDALNLPGVRHAFFTRRGGSSIGVYESLNGGVGSRDAPSAVAENRARMARHFHVAPDRLAIPFQIHSSDALVIDAPFTSENRPRCDALVTTTPDLALGVTGADCGVVLFLDPEAGVIGAAHAGWKGALGGVIEATVAAMERCGAKRRAIRAALGPSIAQKSYEVGPEFLARFVADDPASLGFFIAGARPDRHLFDLQGYIGERARRAGVGAFENLGLDTYADEKRFYSYRRATHRQEPDYGRLVAAIALDPGNPQNP